MQLLVLSGVHSIALFLVIPFLLPYLRLLIFGPSWALHYPKNPHQLIVIDLQITSIPIFLFFCRKPSQSITI
jgi:hypothetical protein